MSLEKTTKFPLIISGPTCCGKSVLASKYTGQTIHSTQLKRKDMYHYLLNIFRDNVILNYSSVYEVIEGKVININNNSITLKNDEVESVYSTGPLFRAALIKENVNLGDNIRFNISTGKLNKVEEIEKDGEMQKNKTIVSEVSLLTIDNLNSNTNILSLNKISDSIRKTTNKNVKNSLKNTSSLKLNYLKIEDIHLLNLEELNVINDLLYEDYKPNLIFTINFDKLSLEKKDTKLFSKCEEISLKKEDLIEKILNEKKVGDVNLDENIRLFLKNHSDRLDDVIDCAKIVSVDKKKGFEKLISEFKK